jgi:acyl-coenzyme A thioesterase PaaI-like protein
MNVMNEPTQERLQAVRQIEHDYCVVCGRSNPRGLHLDFFVRPDKSVEAHFRLTREHQGYHDFSHGGIVAVVLDAAMTNCLFALGLAAMTAELRVRYLGPVVVDRPAKVRAWVEKQKSRLCVMAAELLQDHKVRAKAKGKFIWRRKTLGDNGGCYAEVLESNLYQLSDLASENQRRG